MERTVPTAATARMMPAMISTGRQLFFTKCSHSRRCSLGVRATLSAGLTDMTKTQTVYTRHSRIRKL